VLSRFRQDAARWVVPEAVSDSEELSVLQILNLLRLHRQLRAIAWYRLGSWGEGSRVRGLVWFADQRLQSRFGLDLAGGMEVDGGLYIAHTSGVAINARSIGSNVTIIAGVTVGIRGRGGGPTIEDGAFIGAGARVLGPIRIGRGARVGANAVVLQDVPADTTVVGVPARPSSRAAADVTARSN
jgi:serine O-acetyltransferase